MNKYNKSILPNGKKAAEMTIGTIIIIILALVVLAVIIYGFTTGWNNLWENIKNFGGGKINVASVVNACQVACVSSSQYDYCTLTRKVTFNDKGGADPDNGRDFSCKDLEAKPTVGISCGNIDCSGTVAAGEKTCTNQFGRWQAQQCDQNNGQELITNTLTNIEGHTNAYCCKTTCSSLHGNPSQTACSDPKLILDPSDKSSMQGYNFCCKS